MYLGKYLISFSLGLFLLLSCLSASGQGDQPYYMKRSNSSGSFDARVHIYTDPTSMAFGDIPIYAEIKLIDNLSVGGGVGFLPKRKYNFLVFDFPLWGWGERGFYTTRTSEWGYTYQGGARIWFDEAFQGARIDLAYKRWNFPTMKFNDYALHYGKTGQVLEGSKVLMGHEYGLSYIKELDGNSTHMIELGTRGRGGLYFTFGITFGFGI